MFAYCSNNPIMYVDHGGNIAITFSAAVAAIYAAVKATIAVVAIFATVVVVSEAVEHAPTVTFSQPKVQVAEKEAVEEEVDVAPPSPVKIKKNAVFPENPYDFKPNGLVRIVRKGTTNGKIIQWSVPNTGAIIFEWDEDFKYGPHYHAMLPEWNGQHLDRVHYKAGDAVPEPWNSIYFGD